MLKLESIDLLRPEISGFWIDGTLGEAGHASYALQCYPSIHLIGLDADPHMLLRAEKHLQAYPSRYTLVNQFFDDYFRNYPTNQLPPATILLDLGISMFHYKEAKRGFSYDDEERLDMRLDTHSHLPSAYDIVNTYTQDQLAHIFWVYGEERHSKKIAQAIVNARSTQPIISAKSLSDLIKATLHLPKHIHLHPAAKIFQALRIAVNQELERLENVLPDAFEKLAVGGKLGIITFHSLEDRIVKHFFKTLAASCQCPPSQLQCTCLGAYASLITPKGIRAQAQEVNENPASRSARLRVVQKLRSYNHQQGM